MAAAGTLTEQVQAIAPAIDMLARVGGVSRTEVVRGMLTGTRASALEALPEAPVVVALAEVSGIGREEVVRIWGEVRGNIARLDACPGPHDFTELGGDATVRVLYRCSRCLGVVDAGQLHWYHRGLAHGRADRGG